MIKIIQHGTRQQIECENCGCYFSYENEDIIEKNSSSDFGFVYDKKYLKCPQCSNKIILEQTK